MIFFTKDPNLKNVFFLVGWWGLVGVWWGVSGGRLEQVIFFSMNPNLK